jgi:hypothetical protein
VDVNDVPLHSLFGEQRGATSSTGRGSRTTSHLCGGGLWVPQLGLGEAMLGSKPVRLASGVEDATDHRPDFTCPVGRSAQVFVGESRGPGAALRGVEEVRYFGCVLLVVLEEKSMCRVRIDPDFALRNETRQ